MNVDQVPPIRPSTTVMNSFGDSVCSNASSSRWKRVSNSLLHPPRRPGRRSPKEEGPPRLNDTHFSVPRILPTISIERRTEQDRIQRILQQTSLAVVQGPAGSGKTTMAVQSASYGQEEDHENAFLDNEDERVIVRFVSAKSRSSVWLAFSRMATELNIDAKALLQLFPNQPTVYLQELTRRIYQAIRQQQHDNKSTDDRRILIVLDDLQDQTLFHDLTMHFTKEDDSLQRLDIIVTTRNVHLVGVQSSQLVAIHGFSQNEAQDYVQARLQQMGKHTLAHDVLYLDELLLETNCNPLKLDLAMTYIQSQPMTTLASYVMDLDHINAPHPNNNQETTTTTLVWPQVALALQQLNAASQRVLQYLQYLDGDYISLSLLSAILQEHDRIQLQKMIKPLRRLGLLLRVPNGFQLHPQVQDSCQHFGGWKMPVSQKEILTHLTRILQAQMPSKLTTVHDTAETEIAMQLGPHAERILTEPVRETNAHRAALLAKMGEYHQVVTGDLEQALVHKKEFLDLRINGTPRDLVVCYEDIGSVYEGLGDWNHALDYYQRALDVHRTLDKEETTRADLTRLIQHVGCAHAKLGNSQPALEYHKEAVELLKRENKSDPDMAEALHHLGTAYLKVGQVEPGLECLEQAVELRKQLPNKDTAKNGNDPDVALSLNSLGAAYTLKGDPRKGKEYFEKALEMRKALYGNQPHKDVAISLSNIGNAYSKLGDKRKSLEYKEQALDVRKALYGDRPHPEIALSLHNVGIGYDALGDKSKGLTYKGQALAMRKALYPDTPHADLACSLNSVGVSYTKMGDFQKGLEHYEEALAMYQDLYPGEPHLHVISSLANVGALHDKLGDHEKANKFKSQAKEMREVLEQQNHHDENKKKNSECQIPVLSGLRDAVCHVVSLCAKRPRDQASMEG